MRALWGRVSLAHQVLALQFVVVALVGVVALGLSVQKARRDAIAESRGTVTALAFLEARKSTTIDALLNPGPTTARAVQLASIDAQVATRTDFVIVMTRDGTQITHPDPGQIRRTFDGRFAAARAGAVVTETYRGSAGPSVRAIVPVREPGFGGRVIGMAAVGIGQERIGERVADDARTLLVTAGISLIIAAVGSLALSRRLGRQTLGLGPNELARMYEYRDAVLHSIREGLVVVDIDGRIQVVNDEGLRLLGAERAIVGQPVDVLDIPEPLRDLLRRGTSVADDVWVVRERILVVNQRPARWRGRLLGSVMTLRDQSEMSALTEKVSSLEGFADSLRAQMHESANTLHTIITLIELDRADEAVALATAELRTSQELTDRLLDSVRDPTVAALLIAKTAQAAERGVRLEITADTVLTNPAHDTSDLVRILGNLIDNAIDASLESAPPHRVTVTIREQLGFDAVPELFVRVADSGPGLDPADLPRIVERGWTTKDPGEYGRGLGLALVAQTVRRHNGLLALDFSPEGGAEFLLTLPPPPGTAEERHSGVGAGSAR
ncbi:MAG TPA: ATP-binding protein [Jiangellales bacterium]|nr:ATP-binding protein [Jiangellales bacterium]